MINDTASPSIQKQISFGIRLQTSRESRGLDRQEVASQLRLREQIIIMLENGEFKSGLPLTFIRGYIRNYGRFLEIPEQEIQEMIESLDLQPEEVKINPRMSPIQVAPPSSPDWVTRRTSSKNQLVTQIFTYLIVLTMIGLIGIWWNSHKTTTYPYRTAAATSANSNPTIQITTITNKTITHSSLGTSTNTLHQPLFPQQLIHLTIAQEKELIQFASGNLGIQTAAYLILISIIFYLGARLSSKPWINLFTTVFLSLAFAVLLLTSYVLLNQDNQTRPVNPPPMTVPVATDLLPTTTTPDASTLNDTSFIVTPIDEADINLDANLETVAPTPNLIPASIDLSVEPTVNNDINFDTSLETIAPTANLNIALSAILKVYAQQQLLTQLSNYIYQADVVVSTLNNSTLPQHRAYKKKIRRYRRIYNSNNGYYDNNAQQDNNVPPYYRYNY